MKQFQILIIFTVSILTSCGDSNTANAEEGPNEIMLTETDSVVITDAIVQTTDTLFTRKIPTGESWQNFKNPYLHFKGSLSDTVYIGPNRAIKDPFVYFNETRSNQFVIIEEGEYIGSSGLWIGGDNLIIEGRGKVSLLLDELHDNVMWCTGENQVINNLHMQHLQPGELEGQNCSGRVIGFDGADNITVINCDLNGCGLAGLHDNMGNGTVYIEYNYIHNNSIGAYTDIDGNVWQEETVHPVFKFDNNRMEDNGNWDENIPDNETEFEEED
ncbi:MAG: hypothetical protein HUJ25_15245 [Crocinitomicaceae bacterium]|nr:hypothetical protein [Crocinitomicaceae bacterium]